MKRAAIRIVKVLIIIGVVVNLAMLVNSGALVACAVALVGHSACPRSALIGSVQESQRLASATASIQKLSRVVDHAPGMDLWDTPAGHYWMPAGDTILPFILAEEDLKIYGEGRRGVHPGDIVLDCGANVGTFTKAALQAGARLVVAIEPAPQTLACLRRNLAPEINQGRVIVYPKGVWNRDDWLTLSLDDHNAGANSLVLERSSKRSVRVPLTTIDKLVSELKLERVDFIKMDIEGAEKNALTGARATLLKFKPRMSISPEHLPDDTEAIPAVVKSLQPSYEWDPGHCICLGFSIVRPQALYFY